MDVLSLFVGSSYLFLATLHCISIWKTI